MDIKRMQQLSGILTEGDVVGFPGKEEREHRQATAHAEKQRVGSGAKAPNEVVQEIVVPFIDHYLEDFLDYFDEEFEKYPNLSQAAQGHVLEHAMDYLSDHLREDFDPQ